MHAFTRTSISVLGINKTRAISWKRHCMNRPPSLSFSLGWLSLCSGEKDDLEKTKRSLSQVSKALLHYLNKTLSEHIPLPASGRSPARFSSPNRFPQGTKLPRQPAPVSPSYQSWSAQNALATLVSVPGRRPQPPPSSYHSRLRGWGLCLLPAPSADGPRQLQGGPGSQPRHDSSWLCDLGQVTSPGKPQFPPRQSRFLTRSCPAHPAGRGCPAGAKTLCEALCPAEEQGSQGLLGWTKLWRARLLPLRGTPCPGLTLTPPRTARPAPPRRRTPYLLRALCRRHRHPAPRSEEARGPEG